MPDRPRRRKPRRWPFVAGAAALVLLVLAVSGGLADAGPRLGPERTPGERVVGRRWAVTVDGASITQPYATSPVRVSLSLTVENLTRDYLGYIGQGLVVVLLPDGTEHRESYVSDPGNGFGNPGVVTPVEMEFELASAPAGDTPVTVVLRNEQDRGSFVTSERWAPTAVLGHLRLTAVDAREAA
ncbi:MAG: hypothetical protein Q4F67_16045 [Propionibacteriaceae bacterium]|nr:hypothetical protein [Propionibacteriaceae bacterium]